MQTEQAVRARLGSRYRKLWAATAVSNLGDGVDATALPLLAATLTRDPSLFAGVLVAGRLPWLLFPLHAGVLIDRVDRKRLIAATQVARGVLVAALVVTVIGGWASIWLLYGVAFLLGVGEVVVDIAHQVLVPHLVDTAHLERANGRLFGAEIVANQFAGPPLGGLLFGVAAALPVFFDAASFVVAGVVIAAIPGTYIAPRSDVPTKVRTDIGEGIRWLLGNRVLVTLVVVGAALNAVWMAGFATLALYALEVLGIGGVGFGLLVATSGIGYIAGSFGAERVLPRFRRGDVLLAAVVSEVALELAFGLALHVVVLALALALVGYLAALWDVTAVSLRQTIVPDHLFGRVNSAYRFFQWVSMPLGAFAGGLLADAFGLRGPWIAGAVVLSLVALLSARSLRAA
ncbi:MAG: MFS transporter [Actinomycetota bacterium]